MTTGLLGPASGSPGTGLLVEVRRLQVVSLDAVAGRVQLNGEG